MRSHQSAVRKSCII